MIRIYWRELVFHKFYSVHYCILYHTWCIARFGSICTISKNVKNTHGGVLILACNLTKINTPRWVFFTFFRLYKWYQIAQQIKYSLDSFKFLFWLTWFYVRSWGSNTCDETWFVFCLSSSTCAFQGIGNVSFSENVAHVV